MENDELSIKEGFLGANKLDAIIKHNESDPLTIERRRNLELVEEVSELKEQLAAKEEEVKARDKKIDFLKGELDQLANFNPDWDMLQVTRESLQEKMKTIKDQAKKIEALKALAKEAYKESVGTFSWPSPSPEFVDRQWNVSYAKAKLEGGYND